MRLSRPVARAVLGLLGLGACGESTTFVPIPSLEPGALIFLLHGVEGSSPVVSGPYESGANSFPVRGLAPDEAELYLLAVDISGLSAEVAAFNPEMRSLVRVEVGGETCARGRKVDDALRIPVSASVADLFLLEDRQFSSVDAESVPLALVVPVDDGYCFGTSPLEIRAFGAEAELLPPGTRVGDRVLGPAGSGTSALRRGVHLDEDTVLGASFARLFVFERALPWTNQATHTWSTSAVEALPDPSGGWLIADVALDSTRSQPDHFVLVVVLYWSTQASTSSDSALVELEWTPNGFGAPIVRARSSTQLRFAGADDTGRIIVGGDDGTTFVRALGTNSFELVEGTNLRGLSLRDWAPGTSASESDVFLDAGGTLGFGSLENEAVFRVEPFVVIANSPQTLVTRVAAGGGLEVYFGAESADLSRRAPDGRRSLLSGYLPSAMIPCGAEGVDECGRGQYSNTPETYVARSPSNTLVLVSSSCPAVVEFDPERNCSRAVSEPGASVEQRSGRHFGGIEPGDETLLLVGENGRVMEVPWGSGDR